MRLEQLCVLCVANCWPLRFFALFYLHSLFRGSEREFSDLLPLLVGAFLYLHRMGRRNERELSDLRVYVAKNYNNKEELKNLFNNLQQHFDTRIEDVKQLIIKRGQ